MEKLFRDHQMHSMIGVDAANEEVPDDDSVNQVHLQAIRSSYIELMGAVPEQIEVRLRLAERTQRQTAVSAIEAMRASLIIDNPLGNKTGQLVHFGQLLVLGRDGPARLHARAAHKAGATLKELVGVAELALVTGGMPAYGLGVEIISELASTFDQPDLEDQP